MPTRNGVFSPKQHIFLAIKKTSKSYFCVNCVKHFLKNCNLIYLVICGKHFLKKRNVIYFAICVKRFLKKCNLIYLVICKYFVVQVLNQFILWYCLVTVLSSRLTDWGVHTSHTSVILVTWLRSPYLGCWLRDWVVHTCQKKCYISAV